jgi:carbon storage regulator
MHEVGDPRPTGNGEKLIARRDLIMLVLSRKRGEVITVGNEVTVTVLSIQGERVKLGIVAPAEMPVHRREIFERIERSSPATNRGVSAQDFEINASIIPVAAACS